MMNRTNVDAFHKPFARLWPQKNFRQACCVEPANRQSGFLLELLRPMPDEPAIDRWCRPLVVPLNVAKLGR